MGIIVGIDACRIRSGGGIAHLAGILGESDPTQNGIDQIHLWSYQGLTDKMPEHAWLIKHNPKALEKSLASQLWWQFNILPKEARRNGCNILFAVDAATVCYFRPKVVMSQDMLSYEPGQLKHFGFSSKRIRLIALRFIQNWAMRSADGVIFLTEYARRIIQETAGKMKSVSVIPHGVGREFHISTLRNHFGKDTQRVINCVYVSHAEMYKHQWAVIKAVGELRKRGYDLRLILVGGGNGRARKLINESVINEDPYGEFVECKVNAAHSEIPRILQKADIFIFASSCENMPISLLEAMASGLPIACSNRGPMPEVLRNGGLYFDPEKYISIAETIKRLICEETLRIKVAGRARELSQQYTWKKCGEDTWKYIKECASPV
jgi:glycosyltransferase involved in cell wall biosynthesis